MSSVEPSSCRQHFHLLFFLLALYVLLPSHLAASSSPVEYRELYERILEQHYALDTFAVPEGGLTWAVDTAVWHLESGRIRLLDSSASAPPLGFVFEGRGAFAIEVPDPIELRQLRRFTGDGGLERLSTRFDTLIVHTNNDLPPQIAATSPSEASSAHKRARDRIDHQLRMHRDDTAARLVTALARPGDRMIRAEMRTDAFGWLTYTYDAERLEEIQLEAFNTGYPFVETWLSLDRPEDRSSDGRPAFHYRARVDLEHVAVEADLTTFAKQGTFGQSRSRPLRAKVSTTLTLVPRHDNDHAVRLALTPVAEVTAVHSADSGALQYLRDHIGARSSAIDNDVYDDSLVVLLDSPTEAGTPLSLTIDYEMRIFGFAPGRLWYPTAEPQGTALFDRHRGLLDFVVRDEYAVRAVGVLESDEVRDRTRRTLWRQEDPVKMLSFVVAKRHHEATIALEGSPEIAVFGSVKGYISSRDLELIGADVANSMRYFEELFQSPLDLERLQVATIPATHGQAFDGLLHIGDFTTATDEVARVEMFRAHEVAHQWWGHKVGWQSYRHQWLSEGIAQYSAMMFVEHNVKGGKRYLRQMVAAYSDEILGSLGSVGSQFARPGATQLNRRGIDRLGPIGHGYRSSIGETPTAYSSQAYLKGSLVMHMLRVLTRVMTGSDAAFIDVLRDYADRMEDRYASTEDLAAALADRVPTDWSWFFDQWVYSSEIPTYTWSHRLEDRDGALLLVLEVDQSGVAAGFRMPVPVRIDYSDGRSTTVLAAIDAPTSLHEFTLEGRPKRVVFNPERAVLARVKAK